MGEESESWAQITYNGWRKWKLSTQVQVRHTLPEMDKESESYAQIMSS